MSPSGQSTYPTGPRRFSNNDYSNNLNTLDSSAANLRGKTGWKSYNAVDKDRKESYGSTKSRLQAFAY